MSEFKEGIFKGIPNEVYHAGAGISSSQLKTLLKSPAHFKYSLENRSDPTPAMLLGSLVHTMTQESHLVDHEYWVANCSSRATKVYKDAVSDHPDKTVVLLGEYEKARSMVSAYMKSDIADLLQTTKIEHSIFWNENGVDCKCRPDQWDAGNGIVCDLKTCIDASPEGFSRAVFKFGYHISAAFYLRGIEAATGERPRTWLFSCVENHAPYLTQTYVMTKDIIEMGDFYVDKALEIYRRCQSLGDYPGYSDDAILELETPGWEQRKFEMERGF